MKTSLAFFGIVLFAVLAWTQGDEKEESLLAAASQVHRRMDALLRNTTSLGRLEEDARRALEAGSGRVRRVNAQGELAEAAMAVERKLEGVHHILQCAPLRLHPCLELTQELATDCEELYASTDWSCCSAECQNRWECVSGCSEEEFVVPSDGDSLGVLLPGLQAFAKDVCFLQWSANITWPLQDAHTERADPEMWTFVLDVGGALRAHPHSPQVRVIHDSWEEIVHRSVPPKDVVVLLDVGLMMTAQPLQLAQLAVQHLLDLLDPADRVNIITVGGAAQFLSCPSPGPHLPCASLSVQSFLRGRVAELVAEKDVPDYRTALQLALGTLNSSQSCLKALVVFSAGTLEALTDLFDQHNADRQITVFSYLVGPPVEVVSVKEIGCHNNQGYYASISTASDIPEKLLAIPKVLSRLATGRGEPCNSLNFLHVKQEQCEADLAVLHMPIYGSSESSPKEMVAVVGVVLPVERLLGENPAISQLHLSAGTLLLMNGVSGETLYSLPRPLAPAAECAAQHLLQGMEHQAGHARKDSTTLYYRRVNASHLDVPWVVAIATQEEPMQYVEWQTANQTVNWDEENPMINTRNLWCNEVIEDVSVDVYLSSNTTQSWEGTVPGIREVFGYFPSGLVQCFNACSLLADYPPHTMLWTHAAHGLVAWQHMDGSSVLISSAVKEATWNTTVAVIGAVLDVDLLRSALDLVQTEFEEHQLMLLDDKGFVLWSSEGACPGGGVHLLDYNVSLLHLLVEEGVFQEVDVEKDWEGLAEQAPFAASGRETMQGLLSSLWRLVHVLLAHCLSSLAWLGPRVAGTTPPTQLEGGADCSTDFHWQGSTTTYRLLPPTSRGNCSRPDLLCARVPETNLLLLATTHAGDCTPSTHHSIPLTSSAAVCR